MNGHIDQQQKVVDGNDVPNQHDACEIDKVDPLRVDLVEAPLADHGVVHMVGKAEAAIVNHV